MMSCLVLGLRLVSACDSWSSPASSTMTTPGATAGFWSRSLYLAAPVVVHPITRAEPSSETAPLSRRLRISSCASLNRTMADARSETQLGEDRGGERREKVEGREWDGGGGRREWEGR